MLRVIKNLVFEFILYSVTAYMRNYPTHATSGQGTIQNTVYISKRSK